MIAKKTPKANLEKKRFAFFQIGLLVAGSLCLAAFEYSSAQMEQEKYVADTAPFVDYSDPVFDIDNPEPIKNEKFSKVVVLDENLKTTDKDLPDNNNNVVTPINEKISFDGDDGETLGSTFGIVEPIGEILPFAEIDPKFPGGPAALAAFIQDNFVMPNYIPDYEKGGTVYVQFVVNEDGSIEQVKTRQGISPDLDAAAMAVVSKMPKWAPGEQAGKNVRVRFTVPIRIKLD